MPELGQYGVLVEIKACGLSLPLCDGPSLCNMIRRVGSNRLPAGQDISGIVKAVGSDVMSLRVGDHVTGLKSLYLFHCIVFSVLSLNVNYNDLKLECSCAALSPFSVRN